MNEKFKNNITLEEWPNQSITENGAVGYRTTSSRLLDLNFMVSSLRNQDSEVIIKKFIKAYYESPKYAIKWLFFLRDIREGLGERRTFRICLNYLAISQPQMAEAVMELIPEYGRYDDLLVFVDTPLCKKTCRYMQRQLKKDLMAMKKGLPVSLLGKWLPSINTSSDKTRRLAKIIAGQWGMSASQYRKTLASLRKYSNVLEVKMTDSKWQEIDYAQVPAKANLKYEAAFEEHDLQRRMLYLYTVLENQVKMNGKGIMPYEVVHRLLSKNKYYSMMKSDMLSEIMWMMLKTQGFQNDWGLNNCIVVADGSGSMYSRVSSSTNTLAIEVCMSLAIYFAEQLNGAFHNKAITFSEHPQFIDLQKGRNLKEKLELMLSYNEVANTNIEAVFDMILHEAVSKKVSQESLPGQVLIISDMEFDQASCLNYRWWGEKSICKSSLTPMLFEQIEERYKQAGYKMPRLIFWNVCGRSNTIPKIENETGICLLSGFSQNSMKIAADSKKKDPYESLIQVLDSPRYDAVEQAIAS